MTPRRRDIVIPRAALSRRQMLRLMGLGGAAAFGGGLLAACGIESDSGGEPAAAGGGGAGSETGGSGGGGGGGGGSTVLEFANWPLYIDTAEDDENVHPTLQDFEEATGIKVNYYEEINSNDEYFAKIRNQLANGQPTGRDLMVLTDWMAGRLINLGWLEEIDHSNIPNVDANLKQPLKNVEFDPERKYSVPWQSGLTGIGINPSALGNVSVESVEDLFKPELKGKVTMLSEMRDTMSLVMSSMGLDPQDHSFEDFQKAVDRLQQAVDSGQIRAFTGNEYASDLAAGNIAAAVAWSGDIIQLQFDNPDLEFVVPKDGALLWSDNMLIPKNAAHKDAAEKMMDFVYQPEIAAQIAAWVNYITPVEGAKEAMADIDDSLTDYELIFPSDDMLDRTFGFRVLSQEEEQKYQESFQKVLGV